MNENHNHQNPSERGSVLFYITIAIVLLSALTYAVSRGNRNSASTFTDQQTKAAAVEIIEYGNAVANAVQKLRLRGCSDREISFENSYMTAFSYTNGNAPTDNSCHVFHENGGNIEPVNPSVDFLISGFSLSGEWWLTGANEIENVGTTCGTDDCAELIMMARELKDEICIKINDILGVTNPSGTPPTDTNAAGAPFQGTYSYAQTIGDETAAIDGKLSGCFYNTTDTENDYYQVLIAR